MWRPTFDVAARMTRKAQRPPHTEDGVRVATEVQEWLNRRGKTEYVNEYVYARQLFSN